MTAVAGVKRSGDQGSATLLALAAGVLTISVAFSFAVAGSAMAARHRAQSAADFGALAAGMRVLAGPGPACAAAQEIVVANGAQLTGCEVAGLDAVVSVAVYPDGVAAVGGVATAQARAGPT